MKRGEIYLVEFGQPRGSEPAGLRPALIVQNDVGNQVSRNIIVAAISASGVERVFPVEVRIDPPEGGLSKPSQVDLALLLTVDRSRCTRLIGVLHPGAMEKVDRALRISLALDA